MSGCKLLALSLVFAFTFVGNSANSAETQNSATVVTIQGEMCGGCVKKMQGTLAKVDGIASVEGNAAEKTMTIVPVSGTKLSPKAIWEAIEQAGKKPAKLVGPDGEFASKPNS
jgi:copper chaperone CopZ